MLAIITPMVGLVKQISFYEQQNKKKSKLDYLCLEAVLLLIWDYRVIGKFNGPMDGFFNVNRFTFHLTNRSRGTNGRIYEIVGLGMALINFLQMSCKVVWLFLHSVLKAIPKALAKKLPIPYLLL